MRILTFDIEEWFHILDNDSTKTAKEWSSYESRISSNMDIIFEVLDATNYRASFFVLGWIGEKYPEIVRQIADRGHEIGSHTTMHQLVYEQNRETFYQDVDRSIKTLQDITGNKVRIFRAPGFSITEKNKWAFEVLYELGIEVDSSVFPASRSHGGMPSYNVCEPSLLNYNGVSLKEFPINTQPFLGRQIIYSGGGYFRIMPYSVLRRLTKKNEYVMSYFHPRDFDHTQPIIKDLSATKRFKSYVGLKGAKNKLERWLMEFDFIDLEEAEKKIDWQKVKVVNV